MLTKKRSLEYECVSNEARKKAMILFVSLQCISSIFSYVSEKNNDNKSFWLFVNTCKLWYQQRSSFSKLKSFSLSSDEIRFLADLQPRKIEVEIREDKYGDFVLTCPFLVTDVLQKMTSLREFIVKGMINCCCRSNCVCFASLSQITDLTIEKDQYLPHSMKIPTQLITLDTKTLDLTDSYAKLENLRFSDVYPMDAAVSLPNLKVCDIKKIHIFPLIFGAPSLQEIYLPYFNPNLIANIDLIIETFAFARELKHLVVLDLCFISDLSFMVDGFHHLQCLTVGSEMRDLSCIIHLKSLVFLDLSCSRNLVDISEIANLSRLRVLRLTSCSNLKDMSPIQHLSHLEMLDVTKCKSMTILPDLSNLMKEVCVRKTPFARSIVFRLMLQARPTLFRFELSDAGRQDSFFSKRDASYHV